MNINIIKSEYKGKQLEVTFRYWEGDCACEGKTIKGMFDNSPTKSELIKSINK